MTHPNTDLGTNTELQQLVDQIRSFDADYATPRENMALARALKIVAQDTVRRHEQAIALQARLEEHLAIAETAAELSGVIDVIRPRKRSWFNR
jgi:hypothetical protein